MSQPTIQSPGEKKQDVYTYTAKWPIYSLAWSMRRDKNPRLAIASLLEDQLINKVELLQFNPAAVNDHFSSHTHQVLDHPFPPTNIMFFPCENPATPDLIATSSDYLRIWEIQDEEIKLKALFKGNTSLNSSITSFDWAEFDAGRVAAVSIDTTCTIWDVEKGVVDTQLVAHEKEVYDISWGGVGIFGSVSGDGSVRIFDLRDKERSTIIYENTTNLGEMSPLLRLEWNKADPRFMATVGMDSNKVVVLDIRLPTTPLMELKRHKRSVNAVSWAPCMGQQLCSGGDDSRALIWEVVAAAGCRLENGADDVEPVAWYRSTAEINQVKWSLVELEWIGISFVNKLQVLKV